MSLGDEVALGDGKVAVASDQAAPGGDVGGRAGSSADGGVLEVGGLDVGVKLGQDDLNLLVGDSSGGQDVGGSDGSGDGRGDDVGDGEGAEGDEGEDVGDGELHFGRVGEEGGCLEVFGLLGRKVKV